MDFSSLSFRKEVQEYLHSYGNLLAAMSTPSTPRFSKEELEVLEYSVAEFQKVLVVCVKQ
jgi:hypothetical protein